MASAKVRARLKALRKKYHLGEFGRKASKPKRRTHRRRTVKHRAKRSRRRASSSWTI